LKNLHHNNVPIFPFIHLSIIYNHRPVTLYTFPCAIVNIFLCDNSHFFVGIYKGAYENEYESVKAYLEYPEYTEVLIWIEFDTLIKDGLEWIGMDWNGLKNKLTQKNVSIYCLICNEMMLWTFLGLRLNFRWNFRENLMVTTRILSDGRGVIRFTEGAYRPVGR
jgi:hypothetical protein